MATAHEALLFTRALFQQQQQQQQLTHNRVKGAKHPSLSPAPPSQLSPNTLGVGWQGGVGSVPGRHQRGGGPLRPLQHAPSSHIMPPVHTPPPPPPPPPQQQQQQQQQHHTVLFPPPSQQPPQQWVGEVEDGPGGAQSGGLRVCRFSQLEYVCSAHTHTFLLRRS